MVCKNPGDVDGISVTQIKKSREGLTWNISESQFQVWFLEKGQKNPRNKDPPPTVGSGPLFLKKLLLPNADERAMNTSGAFSAVEEYKIRCMECMVNTRRTHEKEFQTLHIHVPASSVLRPFQIQHGDKQG